MALKAIYSAVAIVGITAAAGAAYWYQNKPTGPKEITAAGSASAPAGGVSAPGGAPQNAQRGGGMPSVEVAKVEASRLQDDAQAVGSLRSKQNVMLRPEVSGRVQTLGFTDGGRVRRGDVIMQLEDGLQRAEIRQAEAQTSIARANLKRNQELVAQNFVAQRVVDEAAAQLLVVEAQMSLACARWDRMRVIAPFDGTVGIRNVNIGDYVKDGADLVNLEDLSSMFVDFRMPERFIGKIRREQTIELQLDAMPGRQFKAKIEAIDPQLDANGRSVLVRAVLPNTGGEPLAQRPGGGPGGGPGGSGAPGGGPGAGGAGARPQGGGGAAAGGKPAEKPVAKPVARPPQQPVSAPNPLAVAPRPVDPMATTCAQFSNAAVTARAAAGIAPGAALGATPSATPGGRGAGGAGGIGTAGGSAGRPAAAGAAPSAAAGSESAPARPSAGGAAAGTRVAGETAGGRPGGGNAQAGTRGAAGGPGAGAGGGAPLRPGMFARVTAVFSVKEAALTIPEEAIVPQGGRQFVIRLVEQTEVQGKEIAEKQAADAAKAAEAAKAAAAAASAPVATGITAAGGAGGGGAGGGGAGGAQPYSMSGFVDGKRWVSQRQEVKLGIRRPGRVEITEGLSESDTVVVAGQQRVQRDNTPVRVIELGRPPGGAPGGAPGGSPAGASAGAPGGASSGAPASAAPAMGNAAAGNSTNTGLGNSQNAASGGVGIASPAAAPAQAAASR